MTNIPTTYMYSENSGFRKACKLTINNRQNLGAGTFIL